MYGIWSIILSKPLVLATIILIILIFGLIAYYIAERLDKRDELRKNNN